jgi:hypothetical protein
MKTYRFSMIAFVQVLLRAGKRALLPPFPPGRRRNGAWHSPSPQPISRGERGQEGAIPSCATNLDDRAAGENHWIFIGPPQGCVRQWGEGGKVSQSAALRHGGWGRALQIHVMQLFRIGLVERGRETGVRISCDGCRKCRMEVGFQAKNGGSVRHLRQCMDAMTRRLRRSFSAWESRAGF